MKKYFAPIGASLLLLLFSGCSSRTDSVESVIAAHAVPGGTLSQGHHPRLFADEKAFAGLKEKTESGCRPLLKAYHDFLMATADSLSSLPKAPVYKLDASGKRLLPVSRETLQRLFFESYAFRYTRDRKYLHQVERDVNAVCDFKDWNPKHYLDCAEMAAAVAIAYDWLYADLSDTTLAKIRSSLKTKAFDTSLLPEYTTKWYFKDTNWNQVCNAGLVCAALSVFEDFPSEATDIVRKAVETDRRAASAIYRPCGAYSEGPVYWNYGTMFQTLLQAALESTLGTDFGLGDVPGLSGTGLFECFMTGSTGEFFNYADNLPERFPSPPLWYLADRFDDPSIVYMEKELIGQKHIETVRMMPLYIFNIASLDEKSITPITAKTYFSPESGTPVAAVRTGWGSDDLYLGIKGGRASSSHAHMDAGEFVFDAFGVRWACDLARQEYAQVENPCKALGGDFWDFSQSSVRWEMFRFNCRNHNTLTVNDRDHDVDGFVAMTDCYDEPGRIGAALDLTPLFRGELVSARRELSIRDESYLEIRDILEAPQECEGGGVNVRWTLVTRAEASLSEDGIILSCDGRKMLLCCSSYPVQYRIWPSGPEGRTKFFDKDVREDVCGFTFTVPAGRKAVIETLLKPVNE